MNDLAPDIILVADAVEILSTTTYKLRGELRSFSASAPGTQTSETTLPEPAGSFDLGSRATPQGSNALSEGELLVSCLEADLYTQLYTGASAGNGQTSDWLAQRDFIS